MRACTCLPGWLRLTFRWKAPTSVDRSMVKPHLFVSPPCKCSIILVLAYAIHVALIDRIPGVRSQKYQAEANEDTANKFFYHALSRHSLLEPRTGNNSLSRYKPTLSWHVARQTDSAVAHQPLMHLTPNRQAALDIGRTWRIIGVQPLSGHTYGSTFAPCYPKFREL